MNAASTSAMTVAAIAAQRIARPTRRGADGIATMPVGASGCWRSTGRGAIGGRESDRGALEAGSTFNALAGPGPGLDAGGAIRIDVSEPSSRRV